MKLIDFLSGCCKMTAALVLKGWMPLKFAQNYKNVLCAMANKFLADAFDGNLYTFVQNRRNFEPPEASRWGRFRAFFILDATVHGGRRGPLGQKCLETHCLPGRPVP